MKSTCQLSYTYHLQNEYVMTSAQVKMKGYGCV
jgi:hypothetical protein